MNLILLSFIVPEISTFIRTDGHGYIDSTIDFDQEYIYFVRLETLPSACYILFNESSIPFYSTSNLCNKIESILYSLSYFRVSV